MITITDLTKIYSGEKIPAVSGLTLTVQKGDVFGFLGPNGAGKTTTVKMIVGLLRPTSGKIQILGSSPEEHLAKSRLGFLPEQPYFYQYLTAREFLEMCGEIFGIAHEVMDKKIPKILRQVVLPEGAWDRKIRTYSKGMQQRLGLAQALINDPELVILDEPMSGLDPLGRKEVKDLILELKKEGKTIFFNSHILSDVEDLCTHIAIIDRGKILLEGDIETVTSHRSTSLESIFLDTITRSRA